MAQIKAFAAQSPTSGVTPHSIERRTLRADDVSVDIDYCGVCHTDIHYVEDDWGATHYPVVPGHEIIGRVTSVGHEVTKFKEGDIVGIGCMVDSCRTCSACEAGLEQYCAEGMTGTYNGKDRYDQSITFGGYSEHIVVSERFVVHIPEKLNAKSAAPLLCAGITTYSPLRYYGVKPGHKVGIVGMGGLGHMGVKFAKALGAKVTLFTRSESKVAEAKQQGIDQIIISTDKEQMRSVSGTLDFILDTVPVQHDVNPYLKCLTYNGAHIMVGLLDPLEIPLKTGILVRKRRILAGSLIGGMPETQEMLDFCAEHNITCDVEMLDIHNINNAYKRMKKGDVKYRFVIDMATLKAG
jgi:uncharacterized zinc-type alcohol dehydrogenase-like protein